MICIFQDRQSGCRFRKPDPSVLCNKHYSPEEIQRSLEDKNYTTASERTIRYWKGWRMEMEKEIVHLIQVSCSVSMEAARETYKSIIQTERLWILIMQMLLIYLSIIVFCRQTVDVLCNLSSIGGKSCSRRIRDGKNKHRSGKGDP